MFAYLNYKEKNNWHNLLEQSPYILTTNFCYTYYFHQKKLKEKPTIKHAASLTLSGQACFATTY